MDKCRFCSSPVDHAAAEAAADIQDKANQAYNDASVIRNMAAVMWMFFLVRFIPFVGIVGWIGMFAMLGAVPVKLILWWLKFGRIKTTDPDYKRAKKNLLIASLIWLPLPLLLVFVIALFVFASLS
jgi:hypothetical protein